MLSDITDRHSSRNWYPASKAMRADLANDETQRLNALREYRILDTVTESAYDDVTALAARICNSPIAAITLVDEHRQWFKSVEIGRAHV